MIRATAIFACCLLFAACGRKGDLYLPDQSKPVVVPAKPQSSPAPAPANDTAATDEERRQRQQQAAPASTTGN